VVKTNFGPFPPVLMRRLRDDAPEGEKRAVFEALIAHYRLTDELRAMTGEPNGSPLKSKYGLTFWSGLAGRLMFDFVPAYRLKKPKSTKGRSEVIEDWSDAGGSLLGWPDDATSFYQAQLVEVIKSRQVESGKSRAWVFRWFANEVAVTTPAEATRRRSILPRPYRKRGTSGSLKEAYSRIPRVVRASPKDYLPKLVVPPYSFLAFARSKGLL
jgi:hypothetical protein